MRATWAIAIGLAVGVPSMASAEFKSGNDLMRDCRSEPFVAANETNCLGFVVGVHDTMEMMGSMEPKGFVCTPVGVQASQLKDVVLQQLDAKPQTRHWTAAALVWNALHDAFPCADAKPAQ